MSMPANLSSPQWRFYVGARGHRPPKSCPGPPNFLVELIGSIVISLSHGGLPNDEGPGPQIFFSRTATGSRQISEIFQTSMAHFLKITIKTKTT